jgi:ABC-2 type transport system ATP-binding protein
VVLEPRHRERPRHRAERDDEALPADRERPGVRLDVRRPRLLVERRRVPEEELGVRAHLAQRDDHVARLERPRRRLGEDRRVEHEVLTAHDRRPGASEEPRHVGARKAAPEDQRATPCLAPGRHGPDDRRGRSIVASVAAIEARALRVRRGGKVVLHDVSLDVAAGAVTGLLGPSGSGKTTLIRAIVGVQIVEAGEVTVLGVPAGAPELRRRVGYVTQAPSVYADLTVRENLSYFARVLGVRAARVDETIATVGLGGQEGQVVRTLSGGERSRVSLATALLGEPDVLVLDEPTVGLDPVLRRDLWDTFHRLAEAGATLLVSSHVMDEAGRCDELALMRDGVVVAAATPAALLERTGAGDLEAAFLALAERP